AVPGAQVAAQGARVRQRGVADAVHAEVVVARLAELGETHGPDLGGPARNATRPPDGPGLGAASKNGLRLWRMGRVVGAEPRPSPRAGGGPGVGVYDTPRRRRGTGREKGSGLPDQPAARGVAKRAGRSAFRRAALALPVAAAAAGAGLHVLPVLLLA